MDYIKNSEHKLHSAMLLIGFAKANETSETSEEVRLYKQNALVFLKLAVQAYLLELSDHYAIPFRSESISVETLSQHLQAHRIPSPELKELLALKSDANSWLAKLEYSYREFFFKSYPEPSDQSNLLAFKKIAAGERLREQSIQELEAWHHALKDLIARQRQQILEW